jgi:hypothetical protein
VEQIPISAQAAGSNFSIHHADNGLYLIYPSTDSLSLTLVTASTSDDPARPVVQDTTHLDRISYSPDITKDFGRHLFLADHGLRHILYVDREGEDSSVLKWLSKSDADETWWIDAFPGIAEPLLAVAQEDGTVQALIEQESTLSLFRFSREGQPQKLLTAGLPSGRWQPIGDVSPVHRRRFTALTAFDGFSNRLYLVEARSDQIRFEAIYSAGEVHYTTILDGQLLVLVYEPARSILTLLEREFAPDASDPRPFDVLPVTLCEDTSSVFLTTLGGERLFLFNERVYDEQDKGSYQLSLLHPGSTDSEYEKTVLLKGEARIRAFQAIRVGEYLYVLFLRADTLTLLSARLTSFED